MTPFILPLTNRPHHRKTKPGCPLFVVSIHALIVQTLVILSLDFEKNTNVIYSNKALFSPL